MNQTLLLRTTVQWDDNAAKVRMYREAGHNDTLSVMIANETSAVQIFLQ